MNLTRKTVFFQGWSSFIPNNLGLGQGMTMTTTKDMSHSRATFRICHTSIMKVFAKVLSAFAKVKSKCQNFSMTNYGY